MQLSLRCYPTDGEMLVGFTRKSQGVHVKPQGVAKVVLKTSFKGDSIHQWELESVSQKTYDTPKFEGESITNHKSHERCAGTDNQSEGTQGAPATKADAQPSTQPARAP